MQFNKVNIISDKISANSKNYNNLTYLYYPVHETFREQLKIPAIHNCID